MLKKYLFVKLLPTLALLAVVVGVGILVAEMLVYSILHFVLMAEQIRGNWLLSSAVIIIGSQAVLLLALGLQVGKFMIKTERLEKDFKRRLPQFVKRPNLFDVVLIDDIEEIDD